MKPLTLLALALLLVAGPCSPEEDPDREQPDPPPDAGDPGDEGPSTDWYVRAIRDTVLRAPDADGCLAPTDHIVQEGTELDVFATDGSWFLVDEDLRALVADDVEVVSEPEEPPHVERQGVVRVDTHRHTWGADGCPEPGEALALHDEVGAIGRAFNSNYNGWVAIDRSFGLAPLRVIDVPGWVYPWHTSVQFVKEIPDQGFVVSAGVLIDPSTILAAAHTGVDETWCFSMEPLAGPAWEEGLFDCASIAGPAEDHPDGVDIAKVSLTIELPGPFADLRTDPLLPGDYIYVSDMSSLNTHQLWDTNVDRITSDNAWCEEWPEDSTFIPIDTLADGGDSGGGVWRGDQLVGIVHGERCAHLWEPLEHVFIHVPVLLDWIEG